MFEVRLSRNDLPKVERAIEFAMKEADAAIGTYLIRQAAPAILDLAKQKCPVLWGDLQRSGRIDVGYQEVSISFGGDSPKKNPPSEYAEIQHEDSTIDHRGARGGKGPYVYLYLKGGVPSFHKYKYFRRDLKANRPKRGQDHFLFGADDAAFETLWPMQMEAMSKLSYDAFKRRLRSF